MEHLLSVLDVSFSYHTLQRETPAISHLTFHIDDNEFLGIIGPSGCGKSTILSMIAGLLIPEDGTIKTSASLGYMFQKDQLFEWLTVFENACLGLDIQKKRTPENIRIVHQMLNDYGLSSFKNAHPSQLSGGLRQRAALIRTLAVSPQLLLLDEPFSALDYQTRLNVSEDIYTILRAHKKSAVLVTHDLSEAIGFCDRIIVLSKRPGHVQYELPIHLSIDQKTPLNARRAKEFQDYFNCLWGELNG